MKRTTCINHVSGGIYLKLNHDFLHICNYDYCQAALLGYYEYRFNGIIEIIENNKESKRNYKPTENDYFIEASPSFLQKALLGLFGRTKIIDANESLAEKGFLKIVTNGTDTTKLQLNTGNVNHALSLIDSKDELNHSFKVRSSSKKKLEGCSETNKGCSETNKSEEFTYSELDIISNTNLNKEINNIPAEENRYDISLLTSDTTMYESKKDNIELNCTIPINDVTIQVEKPKKKSKSNFQSNPDKYTWINARVKEFNEGLPKDRQFTRPNKSGKTREEKAGNAHLLGVVYEKFGEEKATEFFNYIVAKGEWRNPYSISSLKNQEEFENFYQDPQEEQPKYLNDKKFSSFGRYKFDQEEPSLGSFYNEDSFYAALEYYYSQNFSGTELVKKVRERVKEINCKYNKY